MAIEVYFFSPEVSSGSLPLPSPILPASTRTPILRQACSWHPSMNRKRRRQKGQEAGPPPASSPFLDLTRHENRSWFLPVLGMAGLLMGLLLFDANLSLTGDNAQFINLGRSLAEGHGLASTIGDEPKPHIKYPFGFPLLLAVVHLIFPGHLAALKGLVILLYAASIPLVYLFARRWASAPIALGVSALCLLSPPLLDYSHQVMSEIPYLAFSLPALLLLQRAQESKAFSALALATVAVMAAYYVRSAGIVLIGAAIFFLLLHRRWRQAGLVAVGSFLLALPWHLRNAAHGGNPYIDQLLSINPYRPHLGALTFAALAERIAANLELYGLYIIPDILFPGLAGGNPFVGLAISGLVLYALVSGLARRQLPAVYLACYLGLCILWPVVWTDTRFLVPAVPLLFFAMLTSSAELLQRVVRWIGVKSPQPGMALLFLVPFAANILATRDLAGRMGELPASYGNYFAAAEWIRDNTDPQAKVACRKPFLMNAISHRKAAGYIWKGPEEVLADFQQKGIKIVVVDQLGFRSTPEFLVPAVNARMDRFEIVHIVPDPDTYILKFK